MANDSFWNQKGDSDLGIGYVALKKGTAITVITATLTATLTADTTYTSSETSIIGFNSILLGLINPSAGLTSKVVVSSAMSSGGTMIDMIDKDTSAQMTATFTSNKTVKFVGLPDYLGFTATLSAGMTAGSSVSIVILPLNL
jgi:hypothetical protein